MNEGCPIAATNVNHICREVIDGQQRLTTIRIWAKALLDHSKINGETLNYKLTPFYLQSPNDLEFEKIDDGEAVFLSNNNISRVYSYFRFILWLGSTPMSTDLLFGLPPKVAEEFVATKKEGSAWKGSDPSLVDRLTCPRDVSPHETAQCCFRLTL